MTDVIKGRLDQNEDRTAEEKKAFKNITGAMLKGIIEEKKGLKFYCENKKWFSEAYNYKNVVKDVSAKIKAFNRDLEIKE